MRLRVGVPALVIVVAAACASSSAENVGGDSPARDGASDVEAVQVDPVQPDAELAARLDRVIDADSVDVEIVSSPELEPTIVVDAIPYTQYWQSENPSQFALHPLYVGRHVGDNATSGSIEETVSALFDQVGFELPDGGGTAFFYPNVYPLSRMNGPDYMYSAISQSELLAGFAKVDQIEQSELSASRLAAVRDALFFPYARGGVDLEGVAQLELPLMRANPEIILNGWLHSLIHLSDYARAYDDDEAGAYVARNLRFFADNADSWFDVENSISRYSDTSPHRVQIIPGDAAEFPEFEILYASRVPELTDYLVTVDEDLAGELGGYDVRIAARNDGTGTLTATITCSTLFDTTLLSSDAFTLEMTAGLYEPDRASPNSGGTGFSIASEWDDALGRHRVVVDHPDLICGYPTNFSKASGRNFYHVQHVISLLLLAETAPGVDDSVRSELASVAGDWYLAMDLFDLRDVTDFEHPQAVLDRINGGRLLVEHEDAIALIKTADVTVLPAHLLEP